MLNAQNFVPHCIKFYFYSHYVDLGVLKKKFKGRKIRKKHINIIISLIPKITNTDLLNIFIQISLCIYSKHSYRDTCICTYKHIYFYINSWLYVCLITSFFPLTFLPLPNLTTNVCGLVAMYNNRNSEKRCVFFKYKIILHTSPNLPFPKLHCRAYSTGLSHF